MRKRLDKSIRFMWRVGRNFVCAFPVGRRWLFPPQALSQRFGRSDADYAIRVFLHHYRQLDSAGFFAARRVLEIGPGRNLGTALLMWALNRRRSGSDVEVVLWDVFPNMSVERTDLQAIAKALLQAPELHDLAREIDHPALVSDMKAVSDGDWIPDIRYAVQPLARFAESVEAERFDLIYSQAAIEHIWDIEAFWTTIVGLTETGGRHSHRIDLADHGRRETNYIEMLEWSPLAYWLTMRFVPGAINRWRASMHLDFIQRQGMKVESVQREIRPALPIPRSRIHAEFRDLADSDLRTTALDLVAVRVSG